MRLRWTLITAAAASALAPRWQPRSLGQTDLKTQVPLGIGTWQAGNRLLYDYSPARDAALLEAWSSAAAAGVSYFDSGDSYGTGELEGNAETLLGRFSETTANVCVHTKLATYPWRLRAEDFVAACEESKRRTGGVALVGQHWSAESYGLGFLQDPAVYRGLAACVTRGLARGVGLSNLGPRGLRRGVDAVNAAGAPVATHQTQFSLLCRAPLEDGSFDVADDCGVTSVGYSPLCLGLLSGRYTAAYAAALGRRGADASALPNGIRGFLFKTQLPKLADLLGALEAVADEKGATVGQVSLAWCLRARGRDKAPPLALVGARTPDMVRDALGALRLDLSPSDVESLAATAARCPQAQVNAFQTK